MFLQVTRKIKKTLVTTQASHAVAQRHKWTKFGAEKGKNAGPDSSTTSLGSENVRIKLSVGKQEQEKNEQDEAAKAKAELGGKKVSCRLCQGDHFTARCPYKDTLGDIDGECLCLAHRYRLR
jgi:translation initiation factor 3 subunit G